MCMPRRPEYTYRRFGVVLPTSESSNPSPSFSYSFNLKSEALHFSEKSVTICKTTRLESSLTPLREAQVSKITRYVYWFWNKILSKSIRNRSCYWRRFRRADKGRNYTKCVGYIGRGGDEGRGSGGWHYFAGATVQLLSTWRQIWNLKVLSAETEFFFLSAYFSVHSKQWSPENGTVLNSGNGLD